MTVEELQLENQKLNARLAKAVTVFNEQKENISRLTAERNQAMEDAARNLARVTELETKLSEKSSKDDEFFDLINQIDEQRNVNDNLNKQLQEQTTLYSGLSSQYDEYKKQMTDQLNAANEQVKNANAEIAEMQHRLDTAEDEIHAQIESRISLENDLGNKITTLEVTVGNLKAENDKLQQQLNTLRTTAKEQIKNVQKIQECTSNLVTNFNMFG